MKKILMIAALLLACAQAAWSADFEYDNFAYRLNDDGTVTMVYNDYSWSVSGPVVIPDRVLYQGRYYNVTAIDEAFYDNKNITSVTIGKNIKTIGPHSFYFCSGLQGTFTIPEGVTSIGNFAFSNCSGLTGVVIPKSLESMGEYAFYECEGLTAVYITDVAAWCRLRFNLFWDSPLSYAHHLYLNGTEVQNLEIPNEVASINNCAFYECTGLQSMSTGDGVDTIGWRSFYHCTNLRTITLGKNVKYIKNDAFYNCTGLTDIYAYPVNSPVLEDNSVFGGYFNFSSITLHVLPGSKEDYNHYYPWYHCNIVEDLTDENVTPEATISFDTYDTYCEVKATGVGTIQLYVNSSIVDNPYTIQRTNKDKVIRVTATAQKEGMEMSTVTKTFTVPKLEGSGPDPVVLSFTPYDVHTPNNVNGNQNEDYHKLFDKDRTTKWCVDNGTNEWETIWVDFKSNVAFIPTGYTMTTGNDTYSWKGRNPKKWKIYAKVKESDDWTTIVDVADGEAEGLGTNNTTDYNFTIDGVSTEYQHFRFEVSEVRGKGGWQNDHYVFQLAELALDGVTPSNEAGDVNGDGRVNVSDVTALINMILGMTAMDQEAADVNGDGRVNVSDVTALINIILGIN